MSQQLSTQKKFTLVALGLSLFLPLNSFASGVCHWVVVLQKEQREKMISQFLVQKMKVPTSEMPIKDALYSVFKVAVTPNKNGIDANSLSAKLHQIKQSDLKALGFENILPGDPEQQQRTGNSGADDITPFSGCSYHDPDSAGNKADYSYLHVSAPVSCNAGGAEAQRYLQSHYNDLVHCKLHQ